MLPNKDETDGRKLVSFYSMCNCAYFPLLILGLVWTNGIYSAGRYKFGSVISFILFAELAKYFGSVVYLRNRSINLGKKYGEKNSNFAVRVFLTKNRLKEGFKTVIVTSALAFVYFIVSILYGADVFMKHEETVMFSCLLASLTIFPTCVNLGSQSVAALLLGSKPINTLETLLQQNICFTIIGAWLGAFVIPLDWDRPWQVWPIPCSLGALLGYALSHFVMLVQVKLGWKRKLKKPYLFQK